jgi:hypothetical protein
MSKARFTIGQLGGACPQGADQAASLFKRGEKYQLADTIEAGAHPQNVVWMLLKRSDECPHALELMKHWARRCCKAVEIKPKRVLKTGADCFEAVKDAMRARKKINGGSRGNKAWAYEQLAELAKQERE